MTAVYGLATFAGVVSLVLWVVARGAAGGGAESVWDPEARFGAAGRALVAGTAAFGLAGISATFAGWQTVPALLAAVVAAGGLGYLAHRFGPERETSE